MEDSTDIKDIDHVPLATIEQWSGYWSALVLRKKRLHDISTRQTILGQIFTLFVTTGAGFFISENTESLLLIGTSLLIYPVIAESLSSNAAVLTAGLHHKLDTTEESQIMITLKAVVYSLFIAICACLFLGIASGIIGVFLFDASFLLAVRLAVLAGTLTGLIGLPLMVIVLFITRKIEVNPDTVAPPIETTVFNSLALISIVIVSRMIL